jgi:hypothetical protein
MPAPGTPNMVTERGMGLRLGDHYYRGFQDVAIFGQLPIIYDWKSTSNIDQWSKSEEVLRTDNQVILYGLEIMINCNSPIVQCNWVYFQTRGAVKTKKVSFILTAQECIPEILRIKQTSLEIQWARDHLYTALQLPPNPTHCENYGGCKYKSLCKLTPEEMLLGLLNSPQLIGQL